MAKLYALRPLTWKKNQTLSTLLCHISDEITSFLNAIGNNDFYARFF